MEQERAKLGQLEESLRGTEDVIGLQVPGSVIPHILPGSVTPSILPAPPSSIAVPNPEHARLQKEIENQKHVVETAASAWHSGWLNERLRYWIEEPARVRCQNNYEQVCFPNSEMQRVENDMRTRSLVAAVSELTRDLSSPVVGD